MMAVNPKLAAAIEAGHRLNEERIARIREDAVRCRLTDLLSGDWIYRFITETIARGEESAELRPPGSRDEEVAGWWCEAVNRIDGLRGVVKSDGVSPYTGSEEFRVRITWDPEFNPAPPEFGAKVNTTV